MDALVTSIVQSDSAASLSTAQLQALIGLTGATAVALPPSHPLFSKLAVNFSQLSLSGDGGEAESSLLGLRLALQLCLEPSNRPTLFALLESSSEAVDAVLTPSLAALSQPPPQPGAPAGPHSSTVMVSTLMLLVLAAGGGERMRATDVMDLVGADLATVVSLLATAYAEVCGVAVGVAPVVGGRLQAILATRIVQLLHSLTFWSTYHALHADFDRASKAQRAAARDTARTPLDVATGPYRHHLGQIIAHLIQGHFFASAVTYLTRLVGQAAGAEAELLRQVREHLLLVVTLLTMTDQYSTLLRAALLKANLLSSVCVPLMLTLSPPAQLLRGGDGFAVLLQCVDIAATLAYLSGECHRFWDSRAALLSTVVQNVAAAASCRAAAVDERLWCELVAQLVRLAVNAGSTATAVTTPLLTVSQSHLDEAGRQRVAHRLRNPKSRRCPLDFASPAYDTLRPVFRVTTTTTAAAPQPSQRRGGRGGAPPGRQGRNRSRSRGRSRPRRTHVTRRQRMQRRYQVLAQRRGQATQVDAETQQLLAAIDSSDTDSNSDDDEREEGAAEEAVDVAGVAAVPDLSRWRRGPPPRSIPARYICALSHAIIQSSPLLSPTGYLFDERVILDYLASHSVCPISGQPLRSSDLVVDTQLKEELNKVRDNFM